MGTGICKKRKNCFWKCKSVQFPWFFLWANFQQSSTWKVWFFPLQSSGFFLAFTIFDQKIKKFLGKCAFLVYIQLFFPFWGKRVPFPIWKKNGKKALIWRIFKENFSQISQISKMEKILNFHFLMINKFQWVTKHIEFFFGNFHIWYIATHGRSQLFLYHKIGNENTVNLVSLVNSIHSPYFIYF